MNTLMERLLHRVNLTVDEAEGLVRALASGQVGPALAGGLLTALRAKGETAEELAGFSAGMRALARRPAIDAALRARAVDVVGTGGDNAGLVNLSTASALLAAATGVPVIKHGNRSISSKCGSADVLEALGLPVPLDEAGSLRALNATNFTFLFAPHYHPAAGAIAGVRKALGVRTIFNIMGPLTNPASPAFGVIGAYSMSAARLMAAAFARALEREPTPTRVFVVHTPMAAVPGSGASPGDSGLDEPTPAAPFIVLEVSRDPGGKPAPIHERTVHPGDFGITPCPLSALVGGGAAENAEIIRRALSPADQARDARSGVRDAIVLGAALVMMVTGREESPRSAAQAARAAIDDGRAARLLSNLATAWKEPSA